MDDGLQTLKKVLELERSKGFADSIVIGGLDRYLQRLQSGIASEIPSIPQPGYSALAVPDRQAWVEAVLETISKTLTPYVPLSLAKGEGERINLGDTPRPLPEGAAPPLDSPPRGILKPLVDRRICSTPGTNPTAKRPKQTGVGARLDLNSSILGIKGIQTNLASRYGKLGVSVVRDLLYLFPNRHNDFRQTVPIADLVPGTEQTVKGIIWEASVKRMGPKARGTEAIIGDETGNIRAVWFNNQFMARTLKPNQNVALSGRVGLFRGQIVFESPDYEILSEKEQVHTGRLVPVYPLTDGLYQRSVRNLVRRTLDHWVSELPDFLPVEIRDRARLLALPAAVYQAHYPDDDESRDEARRRLAFDELFLMQLRVLARKREWQEGQQAHSIKRDDQLVEKLIASLPFTLTGAQARSLDQVLADMEASSPMSRILQGDVGSGKTVVATGALLQAAAHGFQGAIMVPTEILAEQHYRTICALLGAGPEGTWGSDVLQVFDSFLDRPVRVGFLIGDIRSKAKRNLQQLIREGGVDIVIGTHALIQKEVEFRNLALIVVDEQHRFGVMQRSALRQKGASPHLLVMTATPIPRTLALTLYGDLDLSVLDELPPGRQEIRTKWVQQRQRAAAYDFVREQVRMGRQAFIICPLIDESEAIQARAATKEYERLSQVVFQDLRLGLLHGRLSSGAKDDVMEAFRQGDLDILVSTPVVEVGIDVPNATVMMIEGADRFGLSQLHQFRGRVGRGAEKSYCMLLSERPSAEAKERLTLMQKTNDGFALAEEDLRLRGPGEFFGTRQSGLPDLRMARLSDTLLLEQARREAEELFRRDPELLEPEHQGLAKELARFGAAWAIGGTEA